MPQPKKEVPTLEEFAPRFLDGHARANRQKPSGIAAKEMILRVHLMPALGAKALNAINEDVQRLKHRLLQKSPKTVNNVLTVLSVLLKKAVEWDVIERMPCTVKLLPVPKGSTRFYDFDEYERLVDVARAIDPRTHLIVLLGGEAGIAVRRDDRARVGRRRSREAADCACGGRTGTDRSHAEGWAAATRAADAATGGGASRASAPAEPAGALSGRSDAAHAADRAGPDDRWRRRGGRTSGDGRAHPASHVLFAPGDAWRAGARRFRSSPGSRI